MAAPPGSDAQLGRWSLSRMWMSLNMPTHPLARILVIDDHPSVRFGVREILEDAGYEVTEAASSDEAMPLLTDGKITEAILTDINMPGTLDGLELARMVDGLMPEIAIVIMCRLRSGKLTRECKGPPGRSAVAIGICAEPDADICSSGTGAWSPDDCGCKE